MRVSIVSYGSEGDVRPVAALAVALRTAGHDAVVIAAAAGEQLVAGHGIEFVGLPGGLAEVLAGDASPRNMLAFRWPHREWLDIIVRGATGSEVVVGLPAISYHAASAAQQVGAVGILAGLQPLQPTRDFLPSATGVLRSPQWLNRPMGHLLDGIGWARIGTGVNRVRRELGLARMGNPFHEMPILGAWSPALVPTPSDWDTSQVTVTGDWRLPAQDWTPDPELQAFLDAGDRPIYVGFGSMTGSKVEYALQQVLEAFAHDYRLLVSAPDTAQLGDLPENVRRIGPTPHDLLFPLCGALVHHCGAGTAHAAARSGIPSLPVPFGVDQPFWADRLHRLGVASRIVDPRSGWEAYKAALRDTVAARGPAKSLAATLAAEDGAGAAVTAIERIVALRQA